MFLLSTPGMSKQRKQQNKKRKAVYSHPRQIQNATYMPKNRLTCFSASRDFVVKDAAGSVATGALPPCLEIGANNPRNFTHTTQGTWNASNLGGNGAAVAGLSQWLTDKVPTGSATGSCLNGQTSSCRVAITAHPNAYEIRLWRRRPQ